nr:hypothetical protein [Tanacetum cinerariifolium]
MMGQIKCASSVRYAIRRLIRGVSPSQEVAQWWCAPRRICRGGGLTGSRRDVRVSRIGWMWRFQLSFKMDVEVSVVVQVKESNMVVYMYGMNDIIKDVGFESIEVFADLLEEFVPNLQESQR